MRMLSRDQFVIQRKSVLKVGNNMEAVDIRPQQLETFERNGFTVVEWGGSEIKS